MKLGQKSALIEKVKQLKRTIERDDIKIVYTGMSGGETELDKRAGGYLTTAYMNNLLEYISHLK